MNVSKNALKKERHSLAICGSLWGEKQFLFIFIPFYWFDQKQFFKQILFFLSICRFQTWSEKQPFWVFQCSFQRYTILCLKRKVLYEFPQKCFKTTERYSLEVCSLLCEEKQFLLIFIPFYWFNRKQLFKQIQIFLRIFPF